MRGVALHRADQRRAARRGPGPRAGAGPARPASAATRVLKTAAATAAQPAAVHGERREDGGDHAGLRRQIARQPQADDGHGEHASTPSTRSMNTDATASASGTPRRPSAVARTASPPTLAGRNVPTNVLTKKTCRIAPSPTFARPACPAGRRPRRGALEGHQQPQPAPRHQRAIDDDERTAARSGPRARGSGVLPDQFGSALPEDERGQAQRRRPAGGRCRPTAGGPGGPGGRSLHLAAGIDGSVSR